MQVLYICYTYVFLPFYISCTQVYLICVPQVLESPINGLAWQFLYNWIHMTTFSQRSIIYLSRPYYIFTDKFLSDWTQFLTNYSFVASIIPQLVTLLCSLYRKGTVGQSAFISNCRIQKATRYKSFSKLYNLVTGVFRDDTFSPILYKLSPIISILHYLHREFLQVFSGFLDAKAVTAIVLI